MTKEEENSRTNQDDTRTEHGNIEMSALDTPEKANYRTDEQEVIKQQIDNGKPLHRRQPRKRVP